MIALVSLVLVLAVLALPFSLLWLAGRRRACFEEVVNRTMPVVDGVRLPPVVPPLSTVTFTRVVRRSMARTVSKLQGEGDEDLPAWQ